MRIGNVDVNFVVRSPAFSEFNYDITKIDEILDSFYFYKALENASPTLWEQIYQKRRNGISLKKEELYSLRKYVNRIHFRSTPFGLFASVGIGTWAQTIVADQGSVQKKLKLYFQADPSDGIKQEKNLRFATNPSIQKVGNKVRYIKHTTIDKQLNSC